METWFQRKLEKLNIALMMDNTSKEMISQKIQKFKNGMPWKNQLV